VALVDCGSADGAQRLVVFPHPHRAVRRRIHRENLAGQLPHIPAAEAALDTPDVDENIQPAQEATARLSGLAISSCRVLFGRIGCRAEAAGATISGINTWGQEELLLELSSMMPHAQIAACWFPQGAHPWRHPRNFAIKLGAFAL
jgi:hypothetical protein